MLIDCDRCQVRGAACGDCVVTVLLGGPPTSLDGSPKTLGAPAESGNASSHLVELDPASREAIEILADSGLIPPLRLVLPLAAEPERRDSAG